MATTSASATAVGVPFNPGAQLFSRSSSSLWMATCSAYSSPSGHTWQARLCSARQMPRHSEKASSSHHLLARPSNHRRRPLPIVFSTPRLRRDR